MKAVTNLTRLTNDLLIKKLFSKFAEAYGNIWSTRHKTAGEWSSCAETWTAALDGFSYEAIRDAVTKCMSVYPDFPPTLPQLMRLCFEADGVPTAQEALLLAVQRKFDHPVVQCLFDKIGSWALKTSTDKDLVKMATTLYPEVLSSYLDQIRRFNGIDQVQVEGNNLSEVKKEENKADVLDSKGVIEGVRLYDATLNFVEDIVHPLFNEDQCCPNSTKFSQFEYERKRKYLCGLGEREARSLSVQDQYSRIKFLREEFAEENLKKFGTDVMRHDEGRRTMTRGEDVKHAMNYWKV